MKLTNPLLIFALIIMLSACSNSKKTKSQEQPKQETTLHSPTNKSMDELVEKGKQGDSEAMTELWSNLQTLPNWYLPCRYVEKINNYTPFIGIINEMPLCFAFTDSIKAQEFATKQGLTNPDGETFILKNTPESVKELYDKLKEDGVKGFYFNNGPNGLIFIY